MTYSQKWTIVKLLEPLPEGSVYDWRDWPLHMTLADIFAVDDIEAVVTNLENLAKETVPFGITIDTINYWGEHRVKVALVKPSQQLTSLHKRLLKILSKSSAKFNSPEHVGMGYVPHIAVQNGSPQAGWLVNLADFTLIDMFPEADHEKRRVHRNFHLLAGLAGNGYH